MKRFIASSPSLALFTFHTHSHRLVITDSGRKDAERIAILLELDTWYQAISYGLNLAEAYAEASVKGDTAVVFCTPEQAALLENNKQFIEALCEEGVVEWLTPFVLTKSRQGPGASFYKQIENNNV